jgi:hypothetical protein
MRSRRSIPIRTGLGSNLRPWRKLSSMRAPSTLLGPWSARPLYVRRTPPARCECLRSDTALGAAVDESHAVPSPRQVIPRPLHGVSNRPGAVAAVQADVAMMPRRSIRTRTRASTGLHPTRALRHDYPCSPRSLGRYTRVASHPVLPWCEHVKRRPHRFRMACRIALSSLA